MNKDIFDDMEDWNSPDQNPKYNVPLIIEHNGETLFGAYFGRDNNFHEYGTDKIINKSHIIKWRYGNERKI